MDTLNSTLLRIVEESLTFEKVAAEALIRQLREQGVEGAERFRQTLESQLGAVEHGCINISLDLPDETYIVLSLKPTEIESIHAERLKKVSDFIPEAISCGASQLLVELKKRSGEMHRDHARVRRGFERRLAKLWEKPLSLLEMLIVISQENGSDFNTEFRPDAVRSKDFVFETLTHNHARACQVASEILCLIRGGFADGAHARWRTLHELAVTTCFIKQHGQPVAEQYLLHEHVEAYRGALQYRQYSQRLRIKTIEDDEFDGLKAARDQLVARFGSPYGRDYGWAAQALCGPRPTFAAIERATDLDHWRPYYKLASHNIHAGPKGMKFRLGLHKPGILLAGTSNSGLADPGQGTACSLAHITILLLSLHPNVDRLTVCQVLIGLSSEIDEAFIAVHDTQMGTTEDRSKVVSVVEC